MASDEPNENTPPRFYELLRTLREEGVDFVLIGGFAVTLQGYVRTTKDIDIVPSGDRANYERLWKVLTDLKARPGEIGDVPVEHLPVPFSLEGLVQGGNWVLYTTFGRLDLMPYVEDTEGPLPYDELSASAEEVTLPEIGRPIYVASVEHLIGMKERAGRDLDQVDVTALRRAHGLEAD